jgi:putative ABC transport system substrate-binding protein
MASRVVAKFAVVTLVVAITLGLFPAPRGVGAQPPRRVYRIGYLGTTAAPLPVWEAFLRGLSELGWVEGQTIVIEHRNAEERYERLPELAADLVRLRVDIIVAAGPVAPLAAKQATNTIPIVMTNHGDPVGSGLVASLGRPGANVTGLSFLHPTVVGKQIELLKEIVPKVKRLAVLTNPGNPTRSLMVAGAEAAMSPLGLQLQVLDARGPGEFEAAFSAMRKEHADALLILVDPMLFGQRNRLADLAAMNRLPAVSGLREFAGAGILVTYGANLSDLFRRAATFVDKILKGAKPADLPVEQPTKFDLVINLKTAKALGVTISGSRRKRRWR